MASSITLNNYVISQFSIFCLYLYPHVFLILILIFLDLSSITSLEFENVSKYYFLHLSFASTGKLLEHANFKQCFTKIKVESSNNLPQQCGITGKYLVCWHTNVCFFSFWVSWRRIILFCFSYRHQVWLKSLGLLTQITFTISLAILVYVLAHNFSYFIWVFQ